MSHIIWLFLPGWPHFKTPKVNEVFSNEMSIQVWWPGFEWTKKGGPKMAANQCLSKTVTPRMRNKFVILNGTERMHLPMQFGKNGWVICMTH